jgi:hypothetical protein
MKEYIDCGDVLVETQGMCYYHNNQRELTNQNLLFYGCFRLPML